MTSRDGQETWRWVMETLRFLGSARNDREVARIDRSYREVERTRSEFAGCERQCEVLDFSAALKKTERGVLEMADIGHSQ